MCLICEEGFLGNRHGVLSGGDYYLGLLLIFYILGVNVVLGENFLEVYVEVVDVVLYRLKYL